MDSYSKIQKTITEMMNDRGYTITREFSNVETGSIANPMCIAEKNSDKITTFISYRKIGKKDIEKFIDTISDLLNHHHIILITKDELTSQAKKTLLSMSVKIETFLFKHVIFNVTRHDLQPEFKLLTSTEIKKICEEMTCTLSDLPKLSISDPIARYFNASTKNVFRVYRPANKYRDASITFRIVI